MEDGLLPCGRAGIHFIHKLFIHAFVLYRVRIFLYIQPRIPYNPIFDSISP